jgi:hypothetical protein
MSALFVVDDVDEAYTRPTLATPRALPELGGLNTTVGVI